MHRPTDAPSPVHDPLDLLVSTQRHLLARRVVDAVLVRRVPDRAEGVVVEGDGEGPAQRVVVGGAWVVHHHGRADSVDGRLGSS